MSRRGAHRPARALVALVSLLAGAVVATVSAPGSAATITQQQFVKMLKASSAYRLISGPGQEGLRLLTRSRTATSSGGSGQSVAPSALPRRPLLPLPPPNVRVNDPTTDGVGHPDLTTQSEVTIAQSGSNVVAGYNDDGTSPPPFGGFLSPATDVTGYSGSPDGGTGLKGGAGG